MSSYVSPFVFDEAWVGCPGEANFTEELSANEVMSKSPCFSVFTIPRMSRMYSWVRRRARAMLVVAWRPVA